MDPLAILGIIANRVTKVLIDTGASLSLINLELFNRLPGYIRQNAQYLSSPLQVHLADRSCLAVQKSLTVSITIANRTKEHIVYVVPRLWRPCIIGNDFIKKHNLQIDGGCQEVYFREENTDNLKTSNTIQTENNDERYTLIATECVKIPPYHATYIQILAYMIRCNATQLNMLNQIEMGQKKLSSSETTISEELNLSETNLNEDQRRKLKDLVKVYYDVFRKQNGRTTVLRHQINVIPGSKPYNSPPYRYSPAKRLIIEQNLEEMKAQGIIEPSKSPWASPVVLAPKKDGSIRFCVDYRKLNSITTRDAYPIPRIDDTLDALQEAKFVTTLDLRSGFWQVEMSKESKEKTAFITHKGLYEFNVMPYGLNNAPATLQRLMDIVLAGLKWQSCLVYIDDIVIYSPTFEQHLTDLSNVFQALRDANLTLKISKCCFCRKEMKYLGHIITQNGIKPDPSLTKAVSKFPQPKTIKDVQSFLGLSGYYRRFIKDYAKIAEPLLKQLRQLKDKNYHLKWTAECTTAFENLKKKLTDAPIMSTPNFKEPFILELDACEYGLGAVLTQEYNKQKFVIAFASRTLSPSERNYSATEREALAMVWATQHFRPYLEGTKVLIRTDCKALQWLKNARDISGRLARWAIKLSAFEIESIQYRPGTANANADALSRNPVETVTDERKADGEKETALNKRNWLEIGNIETVINIWENTNILDNIKNEQQEDRKLNHIIQYLKVNPPLQFNDKRQPFVLINDILYKIKNSNRHYNQRILGNKHLLVIPKSRQLTLLKWAHNHPTGGHAGQQKTLFRLSSRVYWASMRKDIFNYIAACEDCKKFKYNNLPLAMPMQLHEILDPWHTIGIDIMGPFPVTARQKRFLLVIVDYFTRWIEVFPMRTTTSTNVAEILINEIFARYGLPRYILSDNGPQFVSNLFQEFCRIMTIKRKLTTNYHPQTNMSERVNRTLKPLIAIFAQNRPHSWDKEIQQLAFAIRTSINETTGDTPAFLMFGRDPRIPLDMIIGDPVQGVTPMTDDQEQIQSYKNQLMHNLRVAFNVVREHSEVEKMNQKMKYDKHTTPRNFKIGDLVWVATPNAQIGDNSIRNKLQAKFQGPCRLMEQLSPSTFLVRRISDHVNLGATNIDRLKLYYKPISEPSKKTTTVGDQLPIQDDSDETNSSQVPPLTDDRVALRLPSNRQRRPPTRYQS